jgi:hypothetical protein
LAGQGREPDQHVVVLLEAARGDLPVAQPGEPEVVDVIGVQRDRQVYQGEL